MINFPVYLSLALGAVRGDGQTPKLVVMVVIDQMREDYLCRFMDLFEGGFKFLMESGIRFTDAHHAHAFTATAPGHFTLASGRYPGRVGIIANEWYDRYKKGTVYCFADPEAKALNSAERPLSYRNTPADAIGDWMKRADPRSKVFAISSKGRAAVPLGGKSPDGVYWLDSATGEYMTTDYYVDRYPPWLQAFNRTRPMDRYLSKTWDRLLADESIYVERSRDDDFPPEASAEKVRTMTTFPHSFPTGGPEETHPYGSLWESPWLDALTFELATLIVQGENLGHDSHPDLLSVGFSSSDGVGHRFGPYSQEVMDMYLRLDKWLGEFFHFLDEEIGLESILLVLSSDHGVATMPEFARMQGMDAARIGKEMNMLLSDVQETLRERFGDGTYLEKSSNGCLYYDLKLLSEKGITAMEVDSVVVPLLLEKRWISNVYSRRQLASDRCLDYDGQLWRNQFHPDLSGDLFVVHRENYILRDPVGTGHKTPHDYDTHIPLIFAGMNIEARLIDHRVETADVAPTIAYFLGIDYPSDVDGRILNQVGSAGEFHKK